ncbi:MAG: hypothetical protein HYV97_05255 [Bdellovibrio sp.]|nr:hypothetical protein [Bdellovibrio sp.]
MGHKILFMAISIMTFTMGKAALACRSNGLDIFPNSGRSGFGFQEMSQFVERTTGTYTAVQDPSEDAFTAADVSEEDLAEATSKLKSFLGRSTGEAALDKMLNKSDEDGDGKVNNSELKDFLAFIGLGNGITRGHWAQGILDYYGTGSPKYLDRESGKKMLIDMELY